jgi:hypothetical protein
MSAPLAALAALVPLLGPALDPVAQDIPDPDQAKPGVLGLVVFLLLAAAVVFLAFSFRKQLRKVDFPEDDEQRQDRERPDEGDRPDDREG